MTWRMRYSDITSSESLPSWVYERTLRIQYADVTHSQQQNVAKGCVFLWKFTVSGKDFL